MSSKSYKSATVWMAIMIVVGMFSSCMKDDEFTTDWNALLSFEQDTVKFDTVFTTIGSSTKRFKVFNHNDKGLRCQSVTLESGGTSGFRINVDGHSGVLLTDIEIPGNDSIFIFTEVTAPVQNSGLPVVLRDKIIFTLENGRQQQLVLQAHGQDVIILKAEELSADQTFSGTRPYLIYDSLVVKPGVQLTVGAGTTLCFHDKAFLSVHGSIRCNGTQEQPVTFRCDRPDRMFANLPYDLLDGQWGGIVLQAKSAGNLFEHTDIHGGDYGIRCPYSTTDATKCVLNSCIIQNVSGTALSLENSIVHVTNSLIANAGDNCLSIYGGQADFVHTTIAQFYLWALPNGTAVNLTNLQNDRSCPLQKAEFDNCLITGWSNDEITVTDGKKDEAALEFTFRNSLINIKMTGKESEDIKARFIDCFNENDLKDQDAIKGDKNFKERPTYQFDFHLTEQSNARNIGSAEFVSSCLLDLDGKERPAEKPDAGCFQYQP